MKPWLYGKGTKFVQYGPILSDGLLGGQAEIGHESGEMTERYRSTYT